MNYQLLDPLSTEAYEALRASIEEVGILQPVTLDEAGEVLDGHHRKRIAEELGRDYPTRVMAGLTEDQKLDASLALNLSGRRLSRDEKREAIRRYLLRRPEVSDRHVGKLVGVDGKTVAAVRGELETTAEIPQSPTRQGDDGRAIRKRKPKSAPDPEAVARRQAEKAKIAARSEKQRTKREAERAEAEAVARAGMAPGATTSSGRTPPRVLATQDRVKAAMNDCVLALTRALQDPGLDVDLVRAEQALPREFRIDEVRLRLRRLVDEFGRRLAELERAVQASATAADSPVRE